MISDSNKKLAQWAMDFAQRNGCQQVKVVLYADQSTTIQLRDEKIDKLQQATEGGMSIYLYVDGRYGTFTTNRLDQKELESFIRNGIDSTRYLAPDEARKLPNPDRYYKGGSPDLKLYDPKLNALNPDEKMQLAQATTREILGKDPRIISAEASFSDGASSVYRLASNGFEGQSAQTWYSLSAGVSIRGEGEARPSDGWWESSIYFDKLIKEGIGQKALERVLRKLGQKKVKSGKYTMIIDPLNASQTISPLLSAIHGSSLQQKNSFLLDKIGQKVASDKFTLIDDPHIPQARGAKYFDNEGIATRKRPVFESGVLKTYFIDTYTANKMNVEPTISGPSILVLKPGDKNLAQLIAHVGNGIVVTGFNGGNCNSSTGDFSYGIEGFLVENGRLTTPISEMNITGNMLTLWNSLIEVGNDARETSSWRIPTLVFDGVDFSGL